MSLNLTRDKGLLFQEYYVRWQIKISQLHLQTYIDSNRHSDGPIESCELVKHKKSAALASWQTLAN